MGRDTTGWLRPRAVELPPDPAAPGADRRVGVLALQGGFAEHVRALHRLGAEAVEVRLPAHLERCDALIMPGGESTTMSKLLATSGLFEAIAVRLAGGMAVFGTCAGLILLANDVLDGRPDQRTFAVLDVTVRRNGYGRQVDSFETDLIVAGLAGSGQSGSGQSGSGQSGSGQSGSAPVHAVFIRAPLVVDAGPDVEVLAAHDDHPVLVRQGRVMAASFHPEMTADLRIHAAFLSLLTDQYPKS